MTQTDLASWYAQLRETHPEMVPAADEDDERKCARDYWTAPLQRVYGIRPWQIGRYTVREYTALVEDLNKFGLGGFVG